MKMRSLTLFIALLVLAGSAAGVMRFTFDSGFMGWQDLTVLDPDQNEGALHWVISVKSGNDHFVDQLLINETGVTYPMNSPHPALLFRSPEFKLTINDEPDNQEVKAWLKDGNGFGADVTGKRVADLPAYAFNNANDPVFPSFLGIALRNVNTGVYDLAVSKPNRSSAWEEVKFTRTQLEALDQDAVYTLDLIDVFAGDWGRVQLDSVTIPGASIQVSNPVPADGAVGVTSGDAAWAEPEYYSAQGYNVYRSMDPNTLDANLVGTASEPFTSLGQFGGDLGYNTTWYWRVDAVDPNDGGLPFAYRGSVWSFTTAGAEPVINAQPRSVNLTSIGETVTVSVDAVCPHGGQLAYQWYRGVSPDTTNPVAGATDASLVVSVTAADFGDYFCRITSVTSAGVVDSRTVVLREKKMLSQWLLDDPDNFQSTVAGSPATVKVGTPTVIPGPAEGLNALHFDGTSGFHTSPDYTSDYFDATHEQMTVAAWVRINSATDSGTATQWTPFVCRFGEQGIGWQLRRHAGNQYACFTTRGVGEDSPTTPTNQALWNNTWHHVVGTYDGTIKKIYLDGQLVGSLAVSGIVNAVEAGHPVSVGYRYPATDATLYGNFLIGDLYDARVYNYALNDYEVAEIYAPIGGAICLDKPICDLSGDCKVGMDDFAILASQWLESGIRPIE